MTSDNAKNANPQAQPRGCVSSVPEKGDGAVEPVSSLAALYEELSRTDPARDTKARKELRAALSRFVSNQAATAAAANQQGEGS